MGPFDYPDLAKSVEQGPFPSRDQVLVGSRARRDSARLDLRPITARYGRDVTFHQLRASLRCTKCGTLARTTTICDALAIRHEVCVSALRLGRHRHAGQRGDLPIRDSGQERQGIASRRTVHLAGTRRAGMQAWRSPSLRQ